MISAVSHGDYMVDYERCGLSPLTNFTIAADVAVATKDVLSLLRRNRLTLCFFMGHRIIFWGRGKRQYLFLLLRKPFIIPIK